MTTWTPRTDWCWPADHSHQNEQGSGPSEDPPRLEPCVVETTGDRMQYRSTKSAMKMAGCRPRRTRLDQSTLTPSWRQVDQRDLQHAALGQDSPPDTHAGPHSPPWLCCRRAAVGGHPGEHLRPCSLTKMAPVSNLANHWRLLHRDGSYLGYAKRRLPLPNWGGSRLHPAKLGGRQPHPCGCPNCAT